jgi:asparagine synthase (glutamine-hydrolysing)
MKVRGLQGKYVLKRALEGIVPREVITRAKTGFAAPIRGWLRNDLREMVGDTLSASRIATRGLFDATAVAPCLPNRTAVRRIAATTSGHSSI